MAPPSGAKDERSYVVKEIGRRADLMSNRNVDKAFKRSSDSFVNGVNKMDENEDEQRPVEKRREFLDKTPAMEQIIEQQDKGEDDLRGRSMESIFQRTVDDKMINIERMFAKLMSKGLVHDGDYVSMMGPADKKDPKKGNKKVGDEISENVSTVKENRPPPRRAVAEDVTMKPVLLQSDVKGRPREDGGVGEPSWGILTNNERAACGDQEGREITNGAAAVCGLLKKLRRAVVGWKRVSEAASEEGRRTTTGGGMLRRLRKQQSFVPTGVG